MWWQSEECLEKTAVTMRLLAQEPTEGDPSSTPKLLLLTGASSCVTSGQTSHALPETPAGLPTWAPLEVSPWAFSSE